MQAKRLQVVLTGAVLTAGGLIGGAEAVAQRCLPHRARTYNRCCLPSRDYALYAQRVSESVVAVASAEQPTPITHYLVKTDEEGTRQAVPVLRKDFGVLRNSIIADDVALERMGLSLYNTGQYACNGVLRFDGGPDGSLLGANVVVRVRAYSGTPQHRGGLTNMRLVWETERPVWVRRGEAKSISLLPEPFPPRSSAAVRVRLTDSWPGPPTDLIHQHFEQITHLEVVLERCKDR